MLKKSLNESILELNITILWKNQSSAENCRLQFRKMTGNGKEQIFWELTVC